MSPRSESAVAWNVLLPVLGLCALSVAFVWSTTHAAATPLWGRQTAFIGVGLLAVWLLQRVHVRVLAAAAWPVYVALIVLLAAMPLLASGNTGTDRWIPLPFGLKLQPSEFMKLGLVAVLARHLQHRGVTDTWGSYLAPFALTVLPWFLVMKQPDLGSSLVLLPVLAAMVSVSGARGRHVGLLCAATAVLLPLAWLLPGTLHAYQRERVELFLRPIPTLMEEARELRQARAHDEAAALEADIAQLRRGAGRQQLYSVMALGAGGVLGEGLGQGSQNRAYGVSVRQSDFIFAIIGQEWGLVGTTAVVALYAWLVAAILGVAWRTREPFGRLLCVGVAALIGGQALMNLGIATGLLPVTGLPLPFVSYGGSSVLALFAAVGCVLSVARHHVDVFFEH